MSPRHYLSRQVPLASGALVQKRTGTRLRLRERSYRARSPLILCNWEQGANRRASAAVRAALLCPVVVSTCIPFRAIIADIVLASFSGLAHSRVTCVEGRCRPLHGTTSGKYPSNPACSSCEQGRGRQRQILVRQRCYPHAAVSSFTAAFRLLAACGASFVPVVESI